MPRPRQVLALDKSAWQAKQPPQFRRLCVRHIAVSFLGRHLTCGVSCCARGHRFLLRSHCACPGYGLRFACRGVFWFAMAGYLMSETTLRYGQKTG